MVVYAWLIPFSSRSVQAVLCSLVRHCLVFVAIVRILRVALWLAHSRRDLQVLGRLAGSSYGGGSGLFIIKLRYFTDCCRDYAELKSLSNVQRLLTSKITENL